MDIAKGGADLKYLTPLEKAIEYIEEHLNENIGLDDVAQEIGYSYYHMTRLFSSVLGESVGHYINRRRIYNASEMLIHSDQRVIDIAFDSGFESPEAFSRAFKTIFGCSPVDYRKTGVNLVTSAKRKMTPEDVVHIANNISKSPEILIVEEKKVAGLRGNVSLSDNRFPELWEQFLRCYKDLLMKSGIGYSICETQKATYTEDGDVLFSVIVGSLVKDFGDLPQALIKKTLKAGKYAVFSHKGTFANLYSTYRYIYGTWIPAAKAELDDREDFEEYQREVASLDDQNNIVKIYIPIK